jgi:ATP-dependent DNA helicase RecG
MSPAERQLELFDQLSYYEGADVEYKDARGGLPRDLWETYSAFANTDGGTIWLGIAQRDGELEVHGLDNPDKLLTDFWNTVNNPGKVSYNLLREADVQRVRLPGATREVIAIKVPRSGRGERPVYIGPHPFRGTFRRNHEGDYRCTEDEVRRMFADRPDQPGDSRILAGFTVADLDAESVQQFRNRFASVKPDHPWLKEDDQGLLLKLGALRIERHGGPPGVTLAGLLMFGRMDAILAPEAVPGFQLDYRERLSEDPSLRWTDRVTVDGTWESNLFQFYQRVILKLSTGPGVKQPFQIDAEGYRRQLTHVHEALQEALVNALIHADYTGQGGVVIDRYVDRFVFSNPGTLLISREQLQAGGVSECRNRSLQRMFQMLGVVDKAGSGIDKIRTSWKAEHWQSPSLRETRGPDRVQLVLPMISTLPDGVIAALRSQFAEGFEALTADEVQTLVTAAVDGSVSNQRLQEMLAVHPADITRLLRGLVQRGFLVQEGTGRWTSYSIPAPVPPNSGVGSPNSGESSPNSGGDSPNLPADRDPDLLAIAGQVRASRRISAPIVRDVILTLCHGRYLTLRQLATLLNRKPETLRDRYLGPLFKDGRLDRRYPASPNHPEQAYRTRA